MTGLEPIVVGFLIRWASEKARKVGERIDGKFDAALAALVDRVFARIGGDPAVEQLRRESAEGIDNPRTAKRVELSLEEAVERDADFAAELRALVAEVQRHAQLGGEVGVPLDRLLQ